MLPVTVRRVLMAQHRVDFRKRFNGLLAEAYRLGADPYDGDCVVFINRDLMCRERKCAHQGPRAEQHHGGGALSGFSTAHFSQAGRSLGEGPGACQGGGTCRA